MDRFTKKTDVLVAGAGIGGCAAAQALQKNSISYLLVEKNVEPGGLTRSISIGDAHFDYTGHFLHLAKFRNPAELPLANQNLDDWMLIKRKSAVYADGKMIPAPLQYNLYHIPETYRELCIKGFRHRPEIKNIRFFNEYLIAGFGQGICDYFLFPYNEKLMARDLKELSADSVKRFFPVPDKEKIEKGYIGKNANPDTGYNSSFWYPKREGIGLLAKGLAKNLNALLTCCSIERVDLASRCAYTPRGEIHYEQMLTSLPLKQFCTLTDKPELHALASTLRHTRVLCLNLLIKSPVIKPLEGYHWIYVPEKAIPFYRLGIYSHISPQMNPQGTKALYIETAFSDGSPLPPMHKLLNNVSLSLEHLGWVKQKEYIVLSSNWIDCAYIHFDLQRKKSLDKITEILQNNCIYPIGRYGLWDYISMEDTILSGIETATSIVKK